MNQKQHIFLVNCLISIFGEGNDMLIDDILPHLELLELNGGQKLVNKNDPADAVFFVVSGRLQSQTTNEDQSGSFEIVRGEILGATPVLTQQKHAETVIAVRDSVLARMPAASFEKIWNQYPYFSKLMAQKMIASVKRAGKRSKKQKPATVCIVPISDGFDIAFFSTALAEQVEKLGTVAIHMRETVESRFGSGSADARPSEELYQRLSEWLDEIEQNHEFTILLSDNGETEWTRRCIRHADEILFVARMDSAMRIHPIEERLCIGEKKITAAKQSLVLLHPDWKRHPSGTAEWLDRRPVDAHYHVRPERISDIARLARILTGNATGLVLSGGGAKGFAHLGVYKALEEAGIEIDFVGGTSIGAVMAAYISFDRPANEIIEFAREAFAINPTGDYNLLPMISVFKGMRLKKTIDGAVQAATGADSDILDSWRTMFCVASSFSGAREVVITRGPLGRMLRASVSIPVALPPVPHNGELLVDGGVFNNFPADVMTKMGVKKIIGVDLSQQTSNMDSYEEIPSSWDLLRDKFRKSNDSLFNVPSIGTILVGTTLLYSESRQKQACESVDLYINPDLGNMGLLEWTAFDKTVDLGYEEARKVISNANPMKAKN